MGGAAWRFALAGLLVFTFLVHAGPADATIYCSIRKTRVGFVALRAAPNAQARLVARMRVGDEVQTHERQGDWEFVTWWKGGRWKGGRFEAQRHGGYDPHNGQGWMLQRFMADDCG
jgi:hypothetical protein